MLVLRALYRCTRSAILLPRAAAGLLLALVLIGGCQPSGIELLEVDAIQPSEVQFGDALHIVGDGFGLGSPASVTLRGEVHRAGRPPERIERTFRADTDSQRELSLTLPRHAERAFCGEAEQASHATFRGDVEVAIAARAAGAPPATGVLRGAVIELYPAVKTRGAQDQSSARGREVLAFLGLEVRAVRGGGLELLRVAPGSRAAAADLRAGDRLLRAGGVTVLQPSDLVPGAERVLELGVARGNLEGDVRVDVDGFTPRPPPAIGVGAAAILAAALWFLSALTPLPRLLGWIAQNWLEQERARRVWLIRPGRSVRAPSWPPLLELAGGASGGLVWLGMAAALAAPLLRRTPVDVSLGLLLTMSTAAALLVALAFAGAGRRWSLRGALRAALHQSAALLPAAAAVLAARLYAGVELDGLVRQQGPWPWQWNAFQGPGMFVACAALLLSALPRPGKPAWRLAFARPPRLSWRSDGDGWFDRLYLCSTCALAAAVFLGGDALPADPDVMSEGKAAALAALLLVTKYTVLVLGVSFLRGLCLGVSSEQWSAFSFRWALPLSLLAVPVAQAWRSLGRSSAFFGWIEHAFGPACVCASALGLLLLVLRAQAKARQPEPPSLSPWL